MIYNILDFGAVGDGITNDTKAIQYAIDVCAENGGGRVLIPSGKVFRSGAIMLDSYVELHLEMGAVLKGSDNLEDYDLFRIGAEVNDVTDIPTYENSDYSGKPTHYFIYAKDCEYVSITGFGKIDGNEQVFYGCVTPWHIEGAFYPRVPLLYLENISHLTLHRITLTGSAFWTTHMVGCKDVLIDGIRILNNLRMANCDGIDPDHCQNVRITNCHIECADDCIVFKNTAGAMQYGPCENVTVSGCTLITTSAAIKFGSESEALFRNFTIQNCNISRTNRGISLQLRDGGCIENVLFSNINIETRLFSEEHWWGKAEPIAITAVKRKRDTKVGHIKNIHFRDINCNSENGILIYGDESCNIENIYFDGITLNLQRKTGWTLGSKDIRPVFGKGMWIDSSNLIYARNAKNVCFTNFAFEKDRLFDDIVKEHYNVKDCEGFVINEIQ